MSDWLSMEQHLAQKKAEAKELGDQYLVWQQPRRRRIAWLSRIFHLRSEKKPEPTPTRPALR